MTEIVEEEIRIMRLQFYLRLVKAAVKEQRVVPLIDTRDGSAAFYTGSEGIYVFMKDFLT